MNLVTIGIIGGVVFIGFLVLSFIFTQLYQRARKEVAYVRTGFGGEKVIKDGGMLQLPVLHEVIPVNMNTMKLEIQRAAEQALITKDRMRVDVTADFYVRVKPTAESISTAAQTLGMKTMNPNELRSLVEGKFVDGLRSVASEMEMEELHEKRSDFVQKVQQTVSEDLFKNGLELESVSLTGLDQTDFRHFNPQNAFDAEGLAKLTETIESRRKKRNEIEQDTDLAIKTKNLEAERARLQIVREEEYAKMEQEREIATRRAEQQAQIEQQAAEKERLAEEAKIAAEREVELKRIQSERDIKEQEIERQKAIEQAEIIRKQTIQIAEQERAIAVAEKSQKESEAKAEADRAKAEAIKAEEQVITARDVEVANRSKEVQLIQAQEAAQKEAIKLTVASQAEKEAATNRAQAIQIQAQADADAQKLLAEAKQKQYEVDAKGQRELHEAGNVMSVEQIKMQIQLRLLEVLPDIIEKSVKPLEGIDGIKLVQMNGNMLPNSNEETGSTGNNSLPEQLVQSALKHRMYTPLLDGLMSDLGLGSNVATNITELPQKIMESIKDEKHEVKTTDQPIVMVKTEQTE